MTKEIEAKAEAILMKYWNSDDLEELQMSITLNPQVQFFILAMCEMYTAALSGIDLDRVVYEAEYNNEGVAILFRKTTIGELINHK